MVAREDLVAAKVLAARPEGVGAPVALGFSGGGARSALVSALHPEIRGVAVMGMLASFPDLMAEHINRHTWIMMSPQIGLVSDWPNIVAARAPRPLFGGYALNDELFPLGGMQAADARLHELYSAAPAAYVAHWSDSAHACDELMQRALLEWLQNIAR